VSGEPSAGRAIQVADVIGPGWLARGGEGLAVFAVMLRLEDGTTAWLCMDGAAAVMLAAEIRNPMSADARSGDPREWEFARYQGGP
jgi:hypothetical protein